MSAISAAHHSRSRIQGDLPVALAITNSRYFQEMNPIVGATVFGD